MALRTRGSCRCNPPSDRRTGPAMSATYRPLPNFYDSKSDKEKVYTNYAVNRLNDYWHLKGMFMRGKNDPIYAMMDSAFHAATYNFLTRYTFISQHKFWRRLTPEQRLRLCKYFTLQEDALKTTISSDDTSALVCVLLAGGVSTTSNLDPSVVVHPVGSLFGAVDVFNAELNDPRFEDDDCQLVYERLRSGTMEQPLERPIFTALMPKGVVLRLTISGYRKAVAAGPLELEEDEEEEEEPDYTLPDDVVLTESDKKLLFTRNLCRKNISSVYYNFLRDEGLLPLIADSPGNDFVKFAAAGSTVTLGGAGMQGTLFLVITGCARVEVDRNGSVLSDGGRIACKTRDPLEGRETVLGSPPSSRDRGVVVKRNSMPLSRLEQGGALLVTQEHFRAADGEGAQLRSSSLPSLSPPRKQSNKRASTPELYQLALRFEKATNYLAIPYRKLADAIKEKDVRGIRDTPIENNLQGLSDKLSERLKRLASWVVGSLDLDSGGATSVGAADESADAADDVSPLAPLGATLLLPKQWSEREMLLGSRQQPLGQALSAETLRLSYSMSASRLHTMQAQADDSSYDERAAINSSFFATEVIADVTDELVAAPYDNPSTMTRFLIDSDSIASEEANVKQ